MTDALSDDYLKAATQAWIARIMLEETNSYLARGRRYESLSAKELEILYVGGMREWDRVVHPRPVYFADVEAEYQLRGAQAPHHKVKPEVERLYARAEAAGAGMTAEQKGEFTRDVVASYEADRARRN